MAATQYGNSITYGGTDCSGAVYGVQSCSSGSKSGTITDIQEWIGEIELTSNIIIQADAAVVIACTANIDSNGYVIIVQDGGYLNTRSLRLPEQSNIGSILIIT